MKVALVGLGRMGRRHVQAVKSLGLDVAAVCDVSQESLDLTEREQGIGRDRHYHDVRDMLARSRPDCLIVATTAPTHAEYTCLAAESGVKYILCEKPMAVSLAQCDRMVDTCRQHGAALAVNHQMRFMEIYRAPKAIAESPAFGGVRSITVIGGNFGLSMNAVHYFEMFRFMTGEPPSIVTAWLSPDRVPNPRGPQFEDRAGAVRLETSTGARFYVDCGADQGHGMQTIYAGRLGHIHVDELRGIMTVVVRDEEHRSLPTTRYGMPSVHRIQNIEAADVIAPSAAVLQALLDRRDYPSGEDGRLAVSVLVGACVSHERGHVAIDLERDELPRGREFPWA